MHVCIFLEYIALIYRSVALTQSHFVKINVRELNGEADAAQCTNATKMKIALQRTCTLGILKHFRVRQYLSAYILRLWFAIDALKWIYFALECLYYVLESANPKCQPYMLCYPR